MATPKRYRSQTGTTLLEVIVAMAVASIALVAFITLVMGSMELEDQARKITEATIAADSKLKEVERAGFPEIGQTEGLLNEQDPSGFSYRLVVSEFQIPGVRQIDAEVFWDKKQHSVKLSAFVDKQ